MCHLGVDGHEGIGSDLARTMRDRLPCRAIRIADGVEFDYARAAEAHSDLSGVRRAGWPITASATATPRGSRGSTTRVGTGVARCNSATRRSRSAHSMRSREPSCPISKVSSRSNEPTWNTVQAGARWPQVESPHGDALRHVNLMWSARRNPEPEVRRDHPSALAGYDFHHSCARIHKLMRSVSVEGQPESALIFASVGASWTTEFKMEYLRKR